MLSAIKSKLQWLEQGFAEVALPEGITLADVRDSVSKIQQKILADLFNQLSDGDPDCTVILPPGFSGVASAFHEQCEQLNVGGSLVMGVNAIDMCRGAIENEPANHALIVDQLCAAVRLHERFSNLLLQGPALREAWAELQSDELSRRNAHAAKLKHANSAKQREKEFILECWKEWQQDPARYASKAAFAADMLTKCEHLKSEKKITDWCREWER